MRKSKGTVVVVVVVVKRPAHRENRIIRPEKFSIIRIVHTQGFGPKNLVRNSILLCSGRRADVYLDVQKTRDGSSSAVYDVTGPCSPVLVEGLCCCNVKKIYTYRVE